ncbi:MAG: 4Fe-4S dicluster domain-containing protein [Magnetococcales bacterium]|nr:4Fe-4S dicluster domain-containing protein [Magnetococcales bacterium]
MSEVVIEEVGCRGCSQCVDVCPVDVFEPEMVEDHQLARVVRTEDCLGCLSCYYACPSQCVVVSDTELQAPYYRIEENIAFVERFLKTKTVSKSISDAEWDEAYSDVAMTLTSLAKAMPDIVGRGMKAVGRRSGSLAASHLPEAYEERDLEGVLKSLQNRFKYCFDFEYQVTEEGVDMDFKPCSLFQVVKDSGDEPGEAVLCQLFHDYLSGLIGAFDGGRYRSKLKEAAPNCCTVKLDNVLL